MLFGFDDTCVGTCRGNFSLFWQEYMSSAVNVLNDAPHISDPTRRHNTHLTFFEMNGNLA